MGGGPASADVVRASCLLTFPEDTMVEPVPVDAWYLHAVGLAFLRRLARDRVGEEPRIALLMQKTDPLTQHRRYISVNSDSILQNALKETFEEPERVLVLHIISLEKVRGQKSIHVTPEINPNVSPEPVEPLGMVFPTLAVESVQAVPEAMAMSSSFRMSRSVYDPEKPLRSSFMAAPAKQLSHSDSILARSQEYGFTNKSSFNEAVATVTTSSHEDNTSSASEDEAPFAFSAAGAKLIADNDDEDSSSSIPLARVVGHSAGEADVPRIPSDYVMLELQNGAGLGDVAPAMAANSASTFFISPTWQLQADELSASARIATPVRAATAPAPARTIREWVAPNLNRSNNSDDTSLGSMEESFVMLDTPQ